jgi:hypothetical protein
MDYSGTLPVSENCRRRLKLANAHMLSQIREQMTDEQIERLDQHRPKPPR